jgi:protein-tyrosine phosphatase
VYRECRDLDYRRVERLVFVCKGNICRSPYAEVRARSMGYCSASAGIEAASGSPANAVASRVAAARGVDLQPHRAQRFDTALLRANDLLLGFEPAHLPVLVRSRGTTPCQVTLLGLFGGTSNPYIHDPHGCPEAYFSICFDRLDASLDALFTKLPPRDLAIRGCA